MIGTIAGKFLTPLIGKALIGALLGGGLIWFWMEFQNRGLELRLAEGELEQVRSYYTEELATKRRQLEQERASAVAARETLERREERSTQLERRVAELRQRNTKMGDCPVHPDIAAAVEWLRQHRGASTEDGD